MRRALLFLTVVAGLAVAASAPAAASSSSTVWDFVSAPDLHPPRLRVLVGTPGLPRGYFLANAQATVAGPAPDQSTQQAAALLMDGQARPVWFLPLSGAFNLQQETYRRRPVLVVYTEPQHAVGRGPGHRRHEGFPNRGRVAIYDEHYRRIATIRVHSPWAIDLHDASIVRGDIWITVVREVKHRNLTAYGGPRNGFIDDVGLQEYRVGNGRLIRTWDALNPRGKPNVPLSESHQGVGADGNWDTYHLNSVQALPNGDLLVSMRNTWAVYLIDPVRHRILWTLGGKNSDFHVPPSARFSWQHDARLVDAATDGQGRAVKLTLFDNNTDRGHARGMVLRLNTVTRKATLVHAYPHGPPYISTSEGSMQLLSNGNTLVDWGSPYAFFTEFSRAGRELLNVAWPVRSQSYRTLFTDTWVGMPYYPPKGAVRGRTGYASWNGATQVSRWEVLAGASSGTLQVVASHPRTGFETAIGLGATYDFYAVRALSADGKVLGTSKVFS